MSREGMFECVLLPEAKRSRRPVPVEVPERIKEHTRQKRYDTPLVDLEEREDGFHDEIEIKEEMPSDTEEEDVDLQAYMLSERLLAQAGDADDNAPEPIISPEDVFRSSPEIPVTPEPAPEARSVTPPVVCSSPVSLYTPPVVQSTASDVDTPTSSTSSNVSKLWQFTVGTANGETKQCVIKTTDDSVLNNLSTETLVKLASTVIDNRGPKQVCKVVLGSSGPRVVPDTSGVFRKTKLNIPALPKIVKSQISNANKNFTYFKTIPDPNLLPSSSKINILKKQSTSQSVSAKTAILFSDPSPCPGNNLNSNAVRPPNLPYTPPANLSEHTNDSSPISLSKDRSVMPVRLTNSSHFTVSSTADDDIIVLPVAPPTRDIPLNNTNSSDNSITVTNISAAPKSTSLSENSNVMPVRLSGLLDTINSKLQKAPQVTQKFSDDVTITLESGLVLEKVVNKPATEKSKKPIEFHGLKYRLHELIAGHKKLVLPPPGPACKDKLFRCRICDEHLSGKVSAQKHIFNHCFVESNVSGYHCPDCTYFCHTFSELSVHSIVHDIFKYKCGPCGIFLMSESQLSKHMNISHRSSIIASSKDVVPNETTGNEGVEENGEEKQSEDKNTLEEVSEVQPESAECIEKTSEVAELDKEKEEDNLLQEVTDNWDKPGSKQERKKSWFFTDFMCSICKEEFQSKRNLYIHAETKHNHIAVMHKKYGRVCKDGEIKCTICPDTFNTIDYFHNHMLQHRGIKPYFCKACSSGFSTRQSFYSHCNIFHGREVKQQVKRGPTNRTKVRFDDDGNVLRPMESLGQVEPTKEESEGKKNILIVCSLCSKRFDSLKELISHCYDDHATNRMDLEECKVNNNGHYKDVCGFSTSKLRELWKHRQKHYQLRPFMCQHCGKLFVHKQNVFVHQSSEHKVGKSYECDICHAVKPTLQQITIHVNKHHLRSVISLGTDGATTTNPDVTHKRAKKFKKSKTTPDIDASCSNTDVNAPGIPTSSSENIVSTSTETEGTESNKNNADDEDFDWAYWTALGLRKSSRKRKKREFSDYLLDIDSPELKEDATAIVKYNPYGVESAKATPSKQKTAENDSSADKKEVTAGETVETPAAPSESPGEKEQNPVPEPSTNTETGLKETGGDIVKSTNISGKVKFRGKRRKRREMKLKHLKIKANPMKQKKPRIKITELESSTSNIEVPLPAEAKVNEPVTNAEPIVQPEKPIESTSLGLGKRKKIPSKIRPVFIFKKKSRPRKKTVEVECSQILSQTAETENREDNLKTQKETEVPIENEVKESAKSEAPTSVSSDDQQTEAIIRESNNEVEDNLEKHGSEPTDPSDTITSRNTTNETHLDNIEKHGSESMDPSDTVLENASGNTTNETHLSNKVELIRTNYTHPTNVNKSRKMKFKTKPKKVCLTTKDIEMINAAVTILHLGSDLKKQPEDSILCPKLIKGESVPGSTETELKLVEFVQEGVEIENPVTGLTQTTEPAEESVKMENPAVEIKSAESINREPEGSVTKVVESTYRGVEIEKTMVQVKSTESTNKEPESLVTEPVESDEKVVEIENTTGEFVSTESTNRDSESSVIETKPVEPAEGGVETGKPATEVIPVEHVEGLVTSAGSATEIIPAEWGLGKRKKIPNKIRPVVIVKRKSRPRRKVDESIATADDSKMPLEKREIVEPNLLPTSKEGPGLFKDELNALFSEINVEENSTPKKSRKKRKALFCKKKPTQIKQRKVTTMTPTCSNSQSEILVQNSPNLPLKSMSGENQPFTNFAWADNETGDAVSPSEVPIAQPTDGADQSVLTNTKVGEEMARHPNLDIISPTLTPNLNMEIVSQDRLEMVTPNSDKGENNSMRKSSRKRKQKDFSDFVKQIGAPRGPKPKSLSVGGSTPDLDTTRISKRKISSTPIREVEIDMLQIGSRQRQTNIKPIELLNTQSDTPLSKKTKRQKLQKQNEMSQLGASMSGDESNLLPIQPSKPQVQDDSLIDNNSINEQEDIPVNNAESHEETSLEMPHLRSETPPTPTTILGSSNNSLGSQETDVIEPSSEGNPPILEPQVMTTKKVRKSLRPRKKRGFIDFDFL